MTEEVSWWGWLSSFCILSKLADAISNFRTPHKKMLTWTRTIELGKTISFPDIEDAVSIRLPLWNREERVKVTISLWKATENLGWNQKLPIYLLFWVAPVPLNFNYWSFVIIAVTFSSPSPRSSPPPSSWWSWSVFWHGFHFRALCSRKRIWPIKVHFMANLNLHLFFQFIIYDLF